jgi:hypothetical protein
MTDHRRRLWLVRRAFGRHAFAASKSIVRLVGLSLCALLFEVCEPDQFVSMGSDTSGSGAIGGAPAETVAPYSGGASTEPASADAGGVAANLGGACGYVATSAQHTGGCSSVIDVTAPRRRGVL